MRKHVLTILLAVAGSAHAAEWPQWTVTNYNEAITIYADVSTIRETGGAALMWDMTDFQTGTALGGNKRALSFKREQEFDCNGQQARILYISWHSGHMGEGEILGSDRKTGDWRRVLVGTVLERLWRTACGR